MLDVGTLVAPEVTVELIELKRLAAVATLSTKRANEALAAANKEAALVSPNGSTSQRAPVPLPVAIAECAGKQREALRELTHQDLNHLDDAAMQDEVVASTPPPSLLIDLTRDFPHVLPKPTERGATASTDLLPAKRSLNDMYTPVSFGEHIDELSNPPTDNELHGGIDAAVTMPTVYGHDENAFLQYSELRSTVDAFAPQSRSQPVLLVPATCMQPSPVNNDALPPRLPARKNFTARSNTYLEAQQEQVVNVNTGKSRKLWINMLQNYMTDKGNVARLAIKYGTVKEYVQNDDAFALALVLAAFVSEMQMQKPRKGAPAGHEYEFSLSSIHKCIAAIQGSLNAEFVLVNESKPSHQLRERWVIPTSARHAYATPAFQRVLNALDHKARVIVQGDPSRKKHQVCLSRPSIPTPAARPWRSPPPARASLSHTHTHTHTHTRTHTHTHTHTHKVGSLRTQQRPPR